MGLYAAILGRQVLMRCRGLILVDASVVQQQSQPSTGIHSSSGYRNLTERREGLDHVEQIACRIAERTLGAIATANDVAPGQGPGAEGSQRLCWCVRSSGDSGNGRLRITALTPYLWPEFGRVDFGRQFDRTNVAG